ncbi:MAG: hypothetical protein JSS79_10585 [Bacteroidetes bacterium]|nr:hypothetical protein [Bacteroidota bacterium]
MTADIKYTVKYHARPVKKVAYILFGFAALIFFLFDLIWTPFKGLTPDMQALTIFYIIPDIFLDINNIAILCIMIGLGLMLFKWRTGKVELTDEKLIIEGSYQVSIWLRNMWEVDVRDMKYHRRTIRFDSNVDAVQIKFKTKKEFEDFSEKLVSLVGRFEAVKLKTSI